MLEINDLKSSKSNNFFLLAGTCVVENEEITYNTALELQRITKALDIPLVFKASYRKANRSRIDSYTGPGDILGLEILSKVGKALNLPLVTDIHESHEAELAAQHVDILQIPAFLCRQTELLVAAAKTGKIVNIKKGQFLSPEAMKFAINKVIESCNKNVMLTERGSMFGYSDMIVDFRGISTMKAMGCPVVMDITHSVQQPNQTSGVTGGQPEQIGTMAKSAIVCGADGIFLETHPNPAMALSDGANAIPLNKVEDLLYDLVELRQTYLKLRSTNN